jgi:hypothetical protein
MERLREGNALQEQAKAQFEAMTGDEQERLLSEAREHILRDEQHVRTKRPLSDYQNRLRLDSTAKTMVIQDLMQRQRETYAQAATG